MTNDGINRDELWEVVIVVNGSLGMSPGKVAGQTFQAAARWQHAKKNSYPDTSLDWLCNGTRTIVKYTDKEKFFERICNEVQGFTFRDEGYTEVYADAATVHVCYPFKHKDRPKVLDSKKLSLSP